MKLEQSYFRDHSTAVWRRRQCSNEISYSDGAEVEEKILRTIMRANDTSSGSDELNLPRMEWPLEYHFSASRADLLSPFQFQGLDVLEVGAGCGALTRFLGEAGARHVVALEGSHKRARITAARCRDLTNIDVICDNFGTFNSDRTFDVILSVGVLEYAPMYFGAKDAIGSFLAKSCALLNESGSFVAAIENQLGLKYFSGCAEDHAGELLYGVQDLYDRERGFVTFGREDLRKIILSAGFSSPTFFYPFPDYKFPHLIFSEAGMRDVDLDAGAIIAEHCARDYSRTRNNLFSEQAVWPVVARNLIGEYLSNSFLVFASKSGLSPLASSVDWLAKCFNGQRRKRFQTVTTFKRVDSKIHIYKEKLHPEIPDGSSRLVQMLLPQESIYQCGTSLEHSLTRNLLKGTITIPDLVSLLDPWCNFLRRNLVYKRGADHTTLLPGHFFDCVPRNLIFSSQVNEDLFYFDAEWTYLNPLKIELVLFRGLLHFSPQYVSSAAFSEVPRQAVMATVFDKLGFKLSEYDLNGCIDAEADFQSLVTTWEKQSWIDETLNFLGSPFPCRETFAGIARQRDELLRCSEDLSNMKSSLSWRLTAPMRSGYRLYERIRQSASRTRRTR